MEESREESRHDEKVTPVALEGSDETEASLRVLHVVDVCPEWLGLSAGAFVAMDAMPAELDLLKSRHRVCSTCQQLDVAASTDRVRFLLANMASR
jgi:hypothetical protein